MKLFKKSTKKASLETLLKAQEKNIKECEKVVDTLQRSMVRYI